MSKIPIVNENDEIICEKDRSEVLLSDVYRASGLWVENSKGEILLAQRSRAKKNDPGRWCPAVAGTVEVGESYEQNIYKEAEEELGTTNNKFNLGPKLRLDAYFQYFAQIFTVTLDWPLDKFVVPKREIEQIKWFSQDKLKEEIKNHPNDFTPAVPILVEKLLK